MRLFTGFPVSLSAPGGSCACDHQWHARHTPPLSHCAMRDLRDPNHTRVKTTLGVVWSSFLSIVFLASVIRAQTDVNSQGGGVLLVKINSVLNPEGRDAAGACCAASGVTRWEISGLRFYIEGIVSSNCDTALASARASVKVPVSPCCVFVQQRRPRMLGQIGET